MTLRKTEKEKQIADGGRGGEVVAEGPNQTTARKPGPLLIKQYSLGVTNCTNCIGTTCTAVYIVSQLGIISYLWSSLAEEETVTVILSIFFLVA